jgi:hypothetical protein
MTVHSLLEGIMASKHLDGHLTASQVLLCLLMGFA